MGRSAERKRAFRIVYEAELRDVGLEEVLEGKREAGEADPTEFCLELARGVLEKMDRLDGISELYAKDWDLNRMPAVDRNILRVGLFELLYRDDIPAGATIDEAVRLAQEFSTDKSGKFINGVLGKVQSDLSSGRLATPHNR